MGIKPATDRPVPAPLPRERLGVARTIGILVRELVPLVGVLAFGWPAGRFLLLSVFNIAFTLASIGTVGVAVSMRKEQASDPDPASELTSWAMLLTACLILSIGLTALFGWVVAVFAFADQPGLFDAALLGSAVAIILGSAPGLLQQYRADLRSPMTEQQRKQRDRPNAMVLVLCAGLIFVTSGFVAYLGHYGLIAMAIAVTALFAFRDLRPDLMVEWTRRVLPTKA